MVSIVIPVCDRVQHTMRCLAALAESTPYDLYEVIVVDNGSSDGTREFLSTLEGDVTVIANPANVGFARSRNQGARRARGEYLLFLDNDTLPQPGWLQALLDVAERDRRVAVVGAKLLSPDDTIWHAGIALLEDAPYPISPVHLHRQEPANAPAANEEREVAAVTGACLLIRADVFREVGGFDEGFLDGYEDVDLCLRVREQGHRIVYTPASVLYHLEPAGEDRPGREAEARSLFHKKWLGRVPAGLFRLGAGDGEDAVAPVPPADGSDRGAASVVVVTYNSLATIGPCLRSLKATLAPQDEVIVVDNASRDGTREYLERLVAGWGRFRVRLNDFNLGFSRACNQGIAEARGDYVVLLNPDTVAPPGWVSRLAAHLRQPGVGAVGPVSNYVAGLQKFQLYLPHTRLPKTVTVGEVAEALYRNNRGGAVETKLLIGFCLMLPRSVLDEVGPLDEDLFLGHDDLDLSWRLRRHGYRLLVATDTFVYHRGQASFETEPSWKTRYLIRQSANFLANKLAQTYGREQVPSPRDLWGIEWFEPTRGLTSIVIPCQDPLPRVRRCVESVLANTPEPIELILVDDGSRDGTRAFLEALARGHPHARVLGSPGDRGFAAACNQGLAAAAGDYLVVLESRVVVTRGWLTRMLAATAISEDIGLVGPRCNRVPGAQGVREVPYGDDLAAMHRFAAHHALRHAGAGHEADCALAFCLLIRRAVIERIGGFDTRSGLGHFQDTDLCLRARLAGFRVWICDDVFVHRFDSAVLGGTATDREKPVSEGAARFRAKWGIAPDGLQQWPVEDMRAMAQDLLYHPLGC